TPWARQWAAFHRRQRRTGVHHVTWRQVELYRQAEAQGRAHRGRLRGSRRLEGGSRTPRLGHRQQAGRRRQEEILQQERLNERRRESRASVRPSRDEESTLTAGPRQPW